MPVGAACRIGFGNCYIGRPSDRTMNGPAHKTKPLRGCPAARSPLIGDMIAQLAFRGSYH